MPFLVVKPVFTGLMLFWVVVSFERLRILFQRNA